MVNNYILSANRIDGRRGVEPAADIRFLDTISELPGQVGEGKKESGVSGRLLISGRGFRTSLASRRGESGKALAAVYQFQDVVSEHQWQVVRGKEERRRRLNIDL